MEPQHGADSLLSLQTAQIYSLRGRENSASLVACKAARTSQMGSRRQGRRALMPVLRRPMPPLSVKLFLPWRPSREL